MYKNIIERMSKEVKDRNEKNKATLSTMTNKEVLNNWAYSKMVTAKAYEEIKNSLPDSSIPADALNENPAALKPLYNHAENGQMFPYSVYMCNGLPQFNGGCGVSCFASVYEACGYKFVEIANDDLFNVYQIETL